MTCTDWPFADWRRIRPAHLTGAGEIDRKIWVFASAHKAAARLTLRLTAFVNRLHIPAERPKALMTDGAESPLRLRALLPIPARFVLDYFHVSIVS